MPPLLCFAAVVVVVHRALAHIFAGNEPNPATAATMSGTPALVCCPLIPASLRELRFNRAHWHLHRLQIDTHLKPSMS